MRVCFGFGPGTRPGLAAGNMAGKKPAVVAPGQGMHAMKGKGEMISGRVTAEAAAVEVVTEEAAAVEVAAVKAEEKEAVVAAASADFRAEAPPEAELLLPDIPMAGMPVLVKDPGTRVYPEKNAAAASRRMSAREKTSTGNIARIFRKPLLAGSEGFGMNELLSLAAALIIAAFIIIPELRNLAGNLMTDLKDWWDKIISGRIFPNS